MDSESIHELIPFAKELLSQKPSLGLLKVYLVGSMFAVLGTVIGLVETVCYPFSSAESMDSDMVLMLAWEQRSREAEIQRGVGGQEEEEEEEEEVEEEEEEEKEELAHKNGAMTQSVTIYKTHTLSQRSMANRLHAS